jgi:geranylgeranyl diphosphate synthase type II
MHGYYLAVIVVLVIVAAVAVARVVQVQRAVDSLSRRFGLDSATRASRERAEPLRALPAGELLRQQSYAESRQTVDALIERAGELGDFGKKGKLPDACLHGLRGGKRLRAVIVLEIARSVAAGGMAADPSAEPVDVADAALAVEYLHAASLVVDDLPEFDDDAVRRGSPAVHAKCGRATAQMAALTLLGAAIQCVARQVDWVRDNRPDIGNPDRLAVRALSCVGSNVSEAAAGQFMDAVVPVDELVPQYGDGAVLELIQKKTAALFEIAFVLGWLFAGGAAEDAESLQRAGRYFGTAFQIADDIGDAPQDAARRAGGKPGWNYANEYGTDAARHEVHKHLNACRQVLQERRLYTPLWTEIYEKVWGMTEVAEASTAGGGEAAGDGEAAGG